MRYKEGQKQETRQRILDAVNRGFRRRGFSGAGVDGLAKEAGVTSGAFYAHFASKAEAFREAIRAGLIQFTEAVGYFQQEYGADWLAQFAQFYLGEKRSCDLAESCALQSLSAEVARSDVATRELFQAELLKAAQAFGAGLSHAEAEADQDAAWAHMAMLIGGVTLARAVQDPELADRIATAVRKAAVE